MRTKKTAGLNKAASAAAPGDPLNVVLELKEMSRPPVAAKNRAEQIQLNTQAFALHIQPLKDKIASLGGEVFGEGAWLNSTISARVPKCGLDALEQDDLVESIDLPRTLERE
jgi:hypothetical protein